VRRRSLKEIKQRQIEESRDEDGIAESFGEEPFAGDGVGGG